jgi:hypothetical protein
MQVFLVLVFLMAGKPVEIQRPIEFAACMSGLPAQTQAQEILHDHPKYTWDGKWGCRIGRLEKQA